VLKKRLLPVDRVTTLVAIAIFVLLSLTLLGYFFPAFQFAFKNAELAAAIESVCILVAFGAFFLCYIRFRVTGELRLLLLALAFLTLGLYNLLHEGFGALMGDHGDETPDLLTHFWLGARLLAAVLLLASLKAGNRYISRRLGVIGIGAVAVAILLLAVLFYNPGISSWPRLLNPAAWESVRAGQPIEVIDDVTLAGGMYQALIGLCFLTAGFGYLRLYRREHRPFWAWLSLSLIVAFFAQINFLMYPSIFDSYVSMGDLMRLLSRVLLFLGLYTEVAYFYRSLQAANQELQAVQEISTLGMSPPGLTRILSGINSTIQKVFDAEKVVMLFLEEKEDGGELVVQGPAIGLNQKQIAGLRLPLSGDNLAVRVLREGRTLVSNNARLDRLVGPELIELLGIESVAIAPLHSATQTIGVINVINKRRGIFSDSDIRFLTIIASRAAIIVENARLHDQLEASAILEERTRLAREIHDGLAQNLGYLNLKLPQVTDYVKSDPGKAEQELTDMGQIVQEALTEARQAIVDLQTPIRGRNLLDAVTEYAHEFSDTTGIEVELISHEKLDGMHLAAKLDMLRIIQEALNNVRRHAGAARVMINFELLNDKLQVKITDDGKGFSTTQAFEDKHWRNFGLRSMKDRAMHLGGELHIQSIPGQGTSVQVEVPLQEETG
jgi:signal transduction histidine kinase